MGRKSLECGTNPLLLHHWRESTVASHSQIYYCAYTNPEVSADEVKLQENSSEIFQLREEEEQQQEQLSGKIPRPSS